MSGRIHIGTSGWNYDHWHGPFYPDDVSADGALEYYAGRFATVEVNNSFYNLPSPDTLEDWRDTAGDDFIFAVKASRYITHMKKLKDPADPVENFLGRMRRLGDSLGPVLFQLPPNWRRNAGRLENFLKVLPEDLRCTFEFRDTDWFDEETYELLGEHNAAFCIYHLAGDISPEKVTADFVYVRLHGPGDAYEGEYGEDGIRPWAERVEAWSAEGRDVYCYFDNDEKGYAALDALRLQHLLAGE